MGKNKSRTKWSRVGHTQEVERGRPCSQEVEWGRPYSQEVEWGRPYSGSGAG